MNTCPFHGISCWIWRVCAAGTIFTVADGLEICKVARVRLDRSSSNLTSCNRYNETSYSHVRVPLLWKRLVYLGPLFKRIRDFFRVPSSYRRNTEDASTPMLNRDRSPSLPPSLSVIKKNHFSKGSKAFRYIQGTPAFVIRSNSFRLYDLPPYQSVTGSFKVRVSSTKFFRNVPRVLFGNYFNSTPYSLVPCF